MTHDPNPSRPPELDAALASRPDRDALAQLWDVLPRATRLLDEPSADARGAAWDRLRATIDDPARVPYAEDVAAPLMIVDDEADEPNEHATSDRTLTAPAEPSVTWSIPTRTTPRWLVAAGIAGLLVAGGAGVRAVPVTFDAARSADAGVAAPVLAVRLADGSNIWLEPGSRLTVARALGWPGLLRASSRDVRLSGRGFFAVQRDGRPFVVHTTDAHVTVLGTRFDVRSGVGATNASRGTQVTVEEGRVAVAAASATGTTGAAVELRAGQRIMVSGAALTASAVRTVTAERVGTWRTGGLAALDESLDAVLRELATRYAVEITHASDINGAATVSLFYPQAPSVETILGDLCTAQGLTFHRTSRGYQITRSGARP